MELRTDARPGISRRRVLGLTAAGLLVPVIGVGTALPADARTISRSSYTSADWLITLYIDTIDYGTYERVRQFKFHPSNARALGMYCTSSDSGFYFLDGPTGNVVWRSRTYLAKDTWRSVNYNVRETARFGCDVHVDINLGLDQEFAVYGWAF